MGLGPRHGLPGLRPAWGDPARPSTPSSPRGCIIRSGYSFPARLAAGRSRPFRAPQAVRQTAPHAALDGLLSLFDFEAEAPKHISHGAWERIAGGAADEIALRWNHEAHEQFRLKPRAPVDVSQLDTRVRLFGLELPFPAGAHRRAEVRAPRGGSRGSTRSGGQGHLRDRQQRFHAGRGHRQRRHRAGVVSALRATGPRLHPRPGGAGGGFQLPRAMRDGRFPHYWGAQPRRPRQGGAPSASCRTSKARTTWTPP